MGGHAPVDRSESRVLTKRTLQASPPTHKERDMSQARRTQMLLARRTGVGRRHVLAGAAAALATAGIPIIKPRRASAAGKIVLRTIGGAYEEAVVKAIIEPFTKATGVEVVKAPATLGKLLAMFESGNIDLEFALLADGVPKDKLYPLDIERGFKSLDRVRPAIRKFWDTGALSAQMLADKEVVLGSIWNGRLQAVADKGAPLAIEWTEASLQSQYWGVLKGAKNTENAQRFIDFACQPELQANLARLIPYGPTNRQAFKSIPADVAARLPSSPEHKARAFLQNGKWWADNRAKVSERWSQWLLQKG